MSSCSIALPQDFCKDAKKAYTLPAKYYTCPDIFDFEADNIFAKSWICVAHVSEVAKPNQYIVREILNESILVLRGRDGVLRAFFNVCPHRGHRLIEGTTEGTAKNVIACPYHAWTFKHDGQMALAPNSENIYDFNMDESCLTSMLVEEYAGFVFINMDSSCKTTVEDQLPGLKDEFLKARPEVYDLKLAARFVTRTPANWKNIVDNYMECYHCGPSHPDFASSVQVCNYWHKMHDHWSLQWGKAIASEKSFNFDGGDSSFSGFWLWPCTMWNATPVLGMLTAIFEFPIDAETTLQHYDIFFTNEELTDYQKGLIDWYRDVFRPEDLRLVESVQRGLHSRGYRGQGRIMADETGSGVSEHGIAYFHSLVAEEYNKAGAK